MTKKYYELHDNNKKILAAMATCVVDPEGYTISFDCEPYSSYDNKKDFFVSNTHLHKGYTFQWK